jgi:hypothetical protein
MKRALEPDLLAEGPKEAAIRHLVQAYDKAQCVRQSMPFEERKDLEAELVAAAAETHTLLRMPLRSPIKTAWSGLPLKRRMGDGAPMSCTPVLAQGLRQRRA